MKAAIEQLSNDTAIVYGSLQFLEVFPQEDPLRPEFAQLVATGSGALSKHLFALRAQVGKRRSQCLRTPYSRVRTNYLKISDSLFGLDRENVSDMPNRDLVLSLLEELQSSIEKPENYADCHTFEQSVLFPLRQFYHLTSPIRRSSPTVVE